MPAAGLVAGRDGRRYQLNDPDAVIEATRDRAAGAPLPIDYDHQSINTEKNGQPALAAGWMTDFETRPDGIWASVEWTERAADHLARREYRFISPTFHYQNSSGEVVRIINAGLTNSPNLVLTALASARISMDEIELANQLRPLLGLTAAAQPDAILEAVNSAISTRTASAAADKYVPIEVFERVTAQLNRMNRGVSAEAAELAVSRAIAAGQLLPALKEWGVALCTENRTAFDGFVERTSGGLQHLFVETAAARPYPSGVAAQDDLDAEIARNLGLSDQPKK